MLVLTIHHLDDLKKIDDRIDCVELRLDAFSIRKKPLFPSIFTLRRKDQGGAKEMRESERYLLIEKYLKLEPEYFDLEADLSLEFLEKLYKKYPKTKFIGSYHNFEKTPEDLEGLFEKMKSPYFSFYKIALKANSSEDLLRLMLFGQKQKNLSFISMGEFGAPSRLLAPILGSRFNYTSFEEDLFLARPSLKVLLERFHYRKLLKTTPLYFLLGDPVERSIGDLFHNKIFQGEALYLKMRVLEKELENVLSLLKKLNTQGMSITMPFKEKIIPFLDEISPEVEKIKAVNTVAFQDGKMIGYNTDGKGACLALEKKMQIEGSSFIVLGAGGSSRAIVYELMQRKAKVLILNRNEKKAKDLAKEMNCSFASLKAGPFSCDAFISTVPRIDFLPEMNPKKVVMELSYFEEESFLQKLAISKQCQWVGGKEMFVCQALLQQEIWSSSHNRRKDYAMKMGSTSILTSLSSFK